MSSECDFEASMICMIRKNYSVSTKLNNYLNQKCNLASKGITSSMRTRNCCGKIFFLSYVWTEKKSWWSRFMRFDSRSTFQHFLLRRHPPAPQLWPEWLLWEWYFWDGKVHCYPTSRLLCKSSWSIVGQRRCKTFFPIPLISAILVTDGAVRIISIFVLFSTIFSNHLMPRGDVVNYSCI